MNNRKPKKGQRKKRQNGVIALFFFMVLLSSPLFSQIPDAPERPECTSIEEFGPGTCDFNEETELAGARVVLFESGGGHGNGKRYLREALGRLSAQYGFIVDSLSPTEFTEETLSDAKVIIYSNNDGAGMPSGAQAQQIEDFVQERGWGMLLVAAACAFNQWEFLQDACIQQYESWWNVGTTADIYVVDSIYQGEPHGRTNPYTSFMLRGIAVRENLEGEYYSWRGNPRISHQYDRESYNKIMLTALDESTIEGFCTPGNCRSYPDQHFLSWTHTMGNGIVLFNSMGHTDIYSQSPDDFGDEMLWRQLRYVAKDWGTPSLRPVCLDSLAGNLDYNFDPETEVSDESVCIYCDDEIYPNYVPGKEESQYEDWACWGSAVEISGFQANKFITTDKLNINVTHKGEYRLKVLKTNGEVVLDVRGFGPEEYPNAVKEAGIYFVKFSLPGQQPQTRRLLVR